MDFRDLFDFQAPEEKPLESYPAGGGLTPILRTVGCIGDSLSSGEFESLDAAGNKGYHDLFEYSWGQFMARDCGLLVRNFSRGGMTASLLGYRDAPDTMRETMPRRGVNPLDTARYILAARSALEGGIFDF